MACEVRGGHGQTTTLTALPVLASKGSPEAVRRGSSLPRSSEKGTSRVYRIESDRCWQNTSSSNIPDTLSAKHKQNIHSQSVSMHGREPSRVLAMKGSARDISDRLTPKYNHKTYPRFFCTGGPSTYRTRCPPPTLCPVDMWKSNSFFFEAETALVQRNTHNSSHSSRMETVFDVIDSFAVTPTSLLQNKILCAVSRLVAKVPSMLQSNASDTRPRTPPRRG